MKSVTTALLTSAVLLSACGGTESTLNPFTWFTAGDEEGVIITDRDGNSVVITDPRVLVDQTLSVKADKTNGGIIVGAVGLPTTQGFFRAGLVPLNNEEPVDGVVTLEFRVVAPLTPQPVGTQRSREIQVAHFISDEKLRGIREIRVTAARNTRSLRP